MAELALTFATSHGLQLNVPPEHWNLLTEKDETDRRLDYDALLKQAPSDMEKHITTEKWQQNYEACQAAQEVLRQELLAAEPDVVIVLGDDQHEQFLERNMPMFCVYYGPSVTVSRHVYDNLPEWLRTKQWVQYDLQGLPEQPQEHPAAPDLAQHVIAYLIDEHFDLSASNELSPRIGLGHAFTFLYRHILPEGGIPIVPFAINTFFPPNQPTPARCYALGQALSRAIKAWDDNKRVAVMASGGLSHVIVDEPFDREVLQALSEKDVSTITSLPRDKIKDGTSEVLNWVALAGAAESMEMKLVDYLPCYRSPAGTGAGMAFAYWS